MEALWRQTKTASDIILVTRSVQIIILTFDQEYAGTTFKCIALAMSVTYMARLGDQAKRALLNKLNSEKNLDELTPRDDESDKVEYFFKVVNA